jgi:hypothetical protein
MDEWCIQCSEETKHTKEAKEDELEKAKALAGLVWRMD